MATKISDIKKEFEAANVEMLPQLIAEYEPDERSGVQSIVKKAHKRIADLAAEKERMAGLWLYEHKYSEYSIIAGVDEAGRGPLAGPVVVGAVIFPKDCDILYINDSKKLNEKKREELYDIIYEKAVSVGVGTYEAARKAVAALDPQPNCLLNDALTIPELDIRQVPIIKGDAKSVSIGAASIIAKVTRDRIMTDYSKEYPEYGFAGHKGYGSAAHISVIEEIGPCPLHRRSFIGNFNIPPRESWRYK